MINPLFPDTRQKLNSLCRNRFRTLMYLLPLLLALASSSKSSAAFIIGRSPICVNDTANYNIYMPTPGITWLWTVPSIGVGVTTSSSSINIQWLSTGTGNILGYGVDAAGDTVETAILGVTVKGPAYPYLTTNYRVACQALTGTPGPQPQPPIIYDTSTCKDVCSGASVTYYAHGNPTSTFLWSATGATSITPMGASNESCQIVWGSPGTNYIYLTEVTATGCKGTTRWCFNVIDKPLAHFETYALFTDNDNSTLNSINICLDDNVLFKDVSTAPFGSPILSCYWVFGDGHFSSSASPTSFVHQYKTAGTYTAMLIVKNACGCTDTAKLTVNVRPEVGLYITCPGVVCEGSVAGYKLNNYGSCPSFPWVVRGGTIISAGPLTDSITVIWDNVDSTGFGMVMFDGSICSGSCNGSVVIKIPVIQNKGKIDGPKVVCVGESAIYRLPQWPTTEFNWNETTGLPTLLPTDQWNEIVFVAPFTPGTYILRANYKNTLLGCGGVAYDTITVIDKATVTGTGKYCQGTNYTWNLPVGMTGDWTLVFPDGTGLMLPTSNSLSGLLTLDGEYKLYVTGAFCPIDTIKFIVTPKPPPVSELIGPDKACPLIPTKYEATVNISGYTFGWNITGGGTASPPSSNITYATFTGIGPWVVSVHREDALGCPSDVASKNVASPITTVNVTGTTVVCGSTRHTYSVDYLEGETYDWSLDDPLAGSITLPTDSSSIGITWNNPPAGTVVNLTVRVRKCGTIMTNSLAITINGAPSLSISGPSSICGGVAAIFNATSTPAITSGTVSWDFDDPGTGFPTTYPAASHIYNSEGKPTSLHLVTLTISEPNGCGGTITATQAITVLGQPSLNMLSGTLNHCGVAPWSELIGDDLGSRAGFTYNWSFNSTPIPSWIAGQETATDINYGAGIYTLTADDGTCATTKHTIITDDCPPPTCNPALAPTLALTGGITSCRTASLTGSWSPLGSGFSPYWEYTDATGVTTTSTTFVGTFGTMGYHSVSYCVKYLTGSDTCVIKKSRAVFVPFVPYFATKITCTGGVYSLTITDESPITYAYALTGRDFYVDGALYCSPTVGDTTFTISSFLPGSTHSIELWMYSPLGYVCTTAVVVEMPPSVVASFTTPKYNPVCEKEGVVEFTNTSPSSADIWTPFWQYGDGTTNNLWSPWKVYDDNVIPLKTAILTLTDKYGCSASVSHTIDVRTKAFSGSLAASSSLSCTGTPTVLTYLPGTGTAVKFRWYEQENFLAENTSSTRTVTEPGGYMTFARDVYGCKVKTDIVPVDFVIPPVVTITGKTEICDSEPYTLTYPAPSYPTPIAYEWAKTGTSSGFYAGGPSFTFTDGPGTYTYILRVIVGTSPMCTTYSAPYVVTVHAAPSTPTISMAIADCNDYKVQLSASGGPGTYTWSSGDAGTPIFVRSGGPYRLWVTNVAGCQSFTNIIVPAAPEVYNWVFPTGCYDLCNSYLPFKILGPKPPKTFDQWDWLMNGLPVSSGMSTSVTPYMVAAPGTYNLALDNGLCADTSDDLNISIKDCPTGCIGAVEFLGATKVTAPPPLCIDYLNLLITCAPGVTYSIFCDNGIIIPGTGVGPTGGPVPFRYIADVGFMGPTDFLNVTFTDPVSGMTCTVRIPINTLGPPCPNSTARRGADEGEERPNATSNATSNELGHLQLIPNPASSSVRITYGFTNKSGQHSLEVIDMAGRRISTEVINNSSGTVQLNLDNYTPGLYQVILRQDGKVFLHSKLSIIK